MTEASEPPKSPTLLPPRKSVELEDPGAHDLGIVPIFKAIIHIINSSFQKRLKMMMMSSPMPQRDKVLIMSQAPQSLQQG